MGNGLNDFKSQAQLPLINLFSSLDHMPYDIDRDSDVLPSLSEMATKAIELMDKTAHEKRTGFFLMIEGSRIDMAAHRFAILSHQAMIQLLIYMKFWLITRQLK